MKLNPLIAGLAVIAISSSAHAVTIERTFDIVASDFILTRGSSTPAPIDPVHLNFTLIFDPSVVIAPTTSGLTINAFTLFPEESIFASDGDGHIAVGQIVVNANECIIGGDTYCLTMAGVASATPTASFDELTSDGNWLALSVTVNASPPGVVAAPEPSTWALMLIGFGGVGWLARRRRWATAAAALRQNC
jgi:PEP-CTERM motif